jgi:hypothetical protein
MYAVGYPARTAVPLNLAVSLVTLTFALVVRSRAVSIGALVPYLNEVSDDLGRKQRSSSEVSVDASAHALMLSSCIADFVPVMPGCARSPAQPWL